MRNAFVVPLFALAVGLAPAVAAQTAPAGAIQLAPDAVKWSAASPTMPPGTQAAVLEGDPKAKGLFTIRLKVPAGARIAPHWHPRDERVTVLSGTAAVGFGEAFDEKGLTRFAAGSFYVNPARSHHYVAFPEETIVQITGEGPWELHFLK
jgi:quercetin dioxygenase-like cupin family protein